MNYDLLAKYFTRNCTEEEFNEVMNWKSASPENETEFLKIEEIYLSRKKEEFDVDVQKLWDELSSEINFADSSSTIRSTGFRILRYAMVILFAALIPLYLVFVFNSPDTLTVIQVSSSEDLREIYLPDSTKITLDTGSKLSWDESFNSGSRTVSLEGEAFFEVTHNPESPFTVKTARGQVTVLGTKFNVRTWDKKETTEVTVLEGRVSYKDNNVGEISAVILEKDDYLKVDTLNNILELSKVSFKTLTWQNGFVDIDDGSLAEIIAQIERWYDAKIFVQNKLNLNQRLSIRITKNSLSANLDLIKTLTGLDYSVNGKTITF